MTGLLFCASACAGLLRITRRRRVLVDGVSADSVRVTVCSILYWPAVWAMREETWTLNEYRQTAAGEKVRVLETAP